MKVLANLKTKKIEGFSRWDDFSFNPLTHVVVDAVDAPDVELDKLNATNDGIDKPTQDDLIALSKAEKIKEIENALQKIMDEEARMLGYDNVVTAITYAAETAVTKFSTDGKSFRKWRSLVWAYAYAELAAYETAMTTYTIDMATYQADLDQYNIDVLADPPLSPLPIAPVLPIEPTTPTIDSIVAGMPVRV